MSSKQSQQLSTPMAIVVGSIIIAIGLVIAFGGNDRASTAPAAGLVQNDGRLTITDAAKKVGVRAKELETCLASDEQLAKVQADTADAQNSGGRGTPYSVLVGPNGETVAVSGAQPIDAWNNAIDAMLAGEITTPEGDPTANVTPVNETDRIRGNVDAPITIIEFSDIDCPFCQRVHPTLEQLIESRPDDVRWVYRHWPIPQLHPNAPEKAEAVECIGAITGDDQTYWEYLDLLVVGE